MTAPFACDMTAIPAQERGAHRVLTRRLMTEDLAELAELQDGLALRFAAKEYDAVTRFVAQERLCCPFVTFTLVVSPERGPLWLRMTGPEGINAFLRAELGLTESKR